ncbi:MAG: alkaline phosphatase family protein [Verrucomicrobiia bacterium]
MKSLRAVLLVLILGTAAHAVNLPPVQTVFVIVLENHNWSEFKGSVDAPFINGTLLPKASYCEQYYTPPGLHPSEPNYLWLEAGTNFGILDDNNPAANHQNTTNHLAAQLRRAGISWKTYQEDIPGTVVPLTAINGYVPRHDPFVFFDDMTGTNDPNDAYGIAHNRPYTGLVNDLTNHTVARYNFITPNLCHDGHNVCVPQNNPVRQTDDRLAAVVPAILGSAAYANNGALFITWDEGSSASDGPIGMVLLSPLARGGGYISRIPYTHSSLLRTMQEIFGLSPWLGDAAHASDLSDLFTPIIIQSAGRTANGAFTMSVTGVAPGWTNFVEASHDLLRWQAISTNWSSSNSFSFTDHTATNHPWQFYRVRQAR